MLGDHLKIKKRKKYSRNLLDNFETLFKSTLPLPYFWNIHIVILKKKNVNEFK